MIAAESGRDVEAKPQRFKAPKSMNEPGRNFHHVCDDGVRRAVAINAEEVKCALAAGYDRDDVLLVSAKDPRAWLEPNFVPIIDKPKQELARSDNSPPARSAEIPGNGVHARGCGGVFGRGAGGGGLGRGSSDSEWLTQVMRVAAGGSVDIRSDGAPLRHAPTVEREGYKRKRKTFWNAVKAVAGGE